MGKGGKDLQDVHAGFLQLAQSESDICFEKKSQIVCLCGSSGKPRGRGEEGSYIRWVKRSVLWNGPAWVRSPLF